MTHVVTSKCKDNRFTDCVVVCPVDAFHLLDIMLVINPDSCIDCSACVTECPVTAIYPEDKVPENEKSYIKFNAEEAEKFPVISIKIPPLTP
jgi:ferredoxin